LWALSESTLEEESSRANTNTTVVEEVRAVGDVLVAPKVIEPILEVPETPNAESSKTLEEAPKEVPVSR
jgi:hypothetical protein